MEEIREDSTSNESRADAVGPVDEKPTGGTEDQTQTGFVDTASTLGLEEPPEEPAPPAPPEPPKEVEKEEAIPAPVFDPASVMCPICRLKSLTGTEQLLHCPDCGRLGSYKDVLKKFEDRAKYGMPPAPKKIPVKVGEAVNPLAVQYNQLVDYVLWLGKHFIAEDNFKCPRCRSYYAPKKQVCHHCHPSGPNVVKK